MGREEGGRWGEGVGGQGVGAQEEEGGGVKGAGGRVVGGGGRIKSAHYSIGGMENGHHSRGGVGSMQDVYRQYSRLGQFVSKIGN